MKPCHNMLVGGIWNNTPNFNKYWKIPPKIVFFKPPPNMSSQLKNLYFHYILHVSIFSFTFFIPLYIYTYYINMIPHMHSKMHFSSFEVYCGCTLLHPQWSTPQRSHSFPKLTLVCHFFPSRLILETLVTISYVKCFIDFRYCFWIC